MMNLFTSSVSTIEIEIRARELGMIYPGELRVLYRGIEEGDDD
jgi:hypothetical protein